MGSEFEVTYSPIVVEKHIPALSADVAIRIRETIEDKLRTAPLIYGKPLRYNLKGYRTLRIGDYRIIFKLTDRLVQVIGILHRSVAYKEAKKYGF